MTYRPAVMSPPFTPWELDVKTVNPEKAMEPRTVERCRHCGCEWSCPECDGKVTTATSHASSTSPDLDAIRRRLISVAELDGIEERSKKAHTEKAGETTRRLVIVARDALHLFGEVESVEVKRANLRVNASYPLDLDLLEQQARQATAEPDEDGGDYNCARCHGSFYVDEESDAGAVCHPCAQSLAEALGTAVLALLWGQRPPHASHVIESPSCRACGMDAHSVGIWAPCKPPPEPEVDKACWAFVVSDATGILVLSASDAMQAFFDVVDSKDATNQLDAPPSDGIWYWEGMILDAGGLEGDFDVWAKTARWTKCSAREALRGEFEQQTGHQE